MTTNVCTARSDFRLASSDRRFDPSAMRFASSDFRLASSAISFAFSYADHPVRVIQINGEPWFVLTDLCRVLGLVRTASAVSERLDDGVRQTYPINDSLGRTQQTTKAISLASTIRGDERERADEGGASRVRGISHQANREGDRSRPGAIQRGHGGCPRNQEVRNPGSHGRRSAPRADRRSCRGVSRSVVPVAGRVTNTCQPSGLTLSPIPSSLSLDIQKAPSVVLGGSTLGATPTRSQHV